VDNLINRALNKEREYETGGREYRIPDYFLIAATSEGLRLLSYLCFFELPSTLISQIYLGSNY
jgi:hypothetical protein